MKDVEINKVFGIPINTLQEWKKNPDDNYRKKLYLFLKSFEKNEAEKLLKKAMKIERG